MAGFRPFDSSFVASSVLGQPEAVQNKFAIIKTGMEGTGPISSLSHDGITGPSGPAVYLLSSETEVYTGSTVSLSTRWPQHQSGKVFHTRDPVNLKKSAFKPIAAITGFRTIGEARWFELLLCYANEPDFWLQYSNIEPSCRLGYDGKGKAPARMYGKPKPKCLMQGRPVDMFRRVALALEFAAGHRQGWENSEIVLSSIFTEETMHSMCLPVTLTVATAVLT